MITFLQQGKLSKHNFLKLDGPEGATHFRSNGEPAKPIAELQTSNRQAGFNPTTTTPLDLPTMNFGNEKQQPANDVLDLPSTL